MTETVVVPARRPRVSVVMPSLNEAANIPHVLAALPPDVFEVVLVDGSSTDGTVAVARSVRPDIRVVAQTGCGKGNALACGMHACRGDVIVMIDTDRSNDPGEIPAFVDALVAGADFAKGSRFIGSGGSADITRVRRAGNRLLNRLVNVVYGTRYTDLCYGYNAIWARHLRLLRLDAGPRADPCRMERGDGFEIETLINIRAALAGLRITEVASFEAERGHGRSNLRAVSDGIRVLHTVVREVRGERPTRGADEPMPVPAPVVVIPAPVVVPEQAAAEQSQPAAP